MLLILKIWNNESGEKVPISDNVPYSVTMHTQKQQPCRIWWNHPSCYTHCLPVDKYLYIFLKSRKA